MASIREQILLRMVAALTDRTPAGPNVFRSREASLTRELVPAIVVQPESEQDQRMGSGTDRHELVVMVAVFVRGDPWEPLADAVAEPAHRMLMGDPELQALAADLRKVSTDYESEEADRTAAVLTARYRVTYLSRAGDIAAAP